MRPAASLLLVRDTAQGLEVLLVRRGEGGDFPGLHVFPGGLVDADDGHPALRARVTGSEADAGALLGLADPVPWLVAALRESLEEVGMLPGAEAAPGALAGWQSRLVSRAARLSDLAPELPGLPLDALGFFSHWITPVVVPRRYDTRFFVARAPASQAPRPDGREAVAADWFRPADALAAHAAGDIRMIFPTIRNLEALQAYPDAGTLLAETRRPRAVPAILPVMRQTPDGVRLLLPGDPGYAAEDAGA